MRKPDSDVGVLNGMRDRYRTDDVKRLLTPGMRGRYE